MPEYRSVFFEGGTYFFTIITYERRIIFDDQEACYLLRKIWIDVANQHPFSTQAFCLLPDHLHCIVTLPEKDSDFPIRIREIKRRFSLSYQPGIVGFQKSQSREKRRESTIWQRRYWEHLIRDEKDFEHHFDYVHFNPVKHNLVKNVDQWQWSSFHHYVATGVYEKNWGDMADGRFDSKYGE